MTLGDVTGDIDGLVRIRNGEEERLAIGIDAEGVEQKAFVRRRHRRVELHEPSTLSQPEVRGERARECRFELVDIVVVVDSRTITNGTLKRAQGG